MYIKKPVNKKMCGVLTFCVENIVSEVEDCNEHMEDISNDYT